MKESSFNFIKKVIYIVKTIHFVKLLNSILLDLP